MEDKVNRMTAWRQENPERTKELRRVGNERWRQRQQRLLVIATTVAAEQQEVSSR